MFTIYDKTLLCMTLKIGIHTYWTRGGGAFNVSRFFVHLGKMGYIPLFYFSLHVLLLIVYVHWNLTRDKGDFIFSYYYEISVYGVWCQWKGIGITNFKLTKILKLKFLSYTFHFFHRAIFWGYIYLAVSNVWGFNKYLLAH